MLKVDRYFRLCDFVVVTKDYKNCFSKKYKIPIVGLVTLKKEIVDKESRRINEFHVSKRIPKKYQATNESYRNSGFDRGHFSANNADFDDTIQDEYLTYAFTNIVPQYPRTNRVSYKHVEDYARLLVDRYEQINVISIAIPSKNYLKGHVNIPKEFYKMLIYENICECFHIPNDNAEYNLDALRVDCSVVEVKIRNLFRAL